MSDAVRIGILGPLEVTHDGRVMNVGGARLRALLTLLALDAGRTLSAERLIDDLWEDRPPSGASNALQSLVSRLRAAVGRDLIASPNGGYRLDLAREAVDAHAFETAVVRARTADPGERSEQLRAALRLWRGPALADLARLPCAEGPIARLEGLRRTALEERIDADLALGRHVELIPELQALTAAEPLRESLRGLLMRALYRAGRQAEALEVYAATRRLLAETLGVDPSPELEAVHLSVLRHDPELTPPPRSEEPPAAGEAPRGNLRARLTSFIGRDDEVKRVVKMLGESRLVTLTGPGGAGKTRLSLECGERLLTGMHMPDGVWAVELAPVTDPAEVPHAVLATLGLRDAQIIHSRTGLSTAEATDPLDRLSAVLSGKRTLILLDNCEHLLDAAAELAARLLADCPEARVLATSREPLGITGETLWPVNPLELPLDDVEPDEAVAYPAIRLFTDRAVAVRPGFTVSQANVAQVVRICRALDGLPLAIELAAARLRTLTPGQLADRLGDRFRLLAAGSRVALPRHKTLRAVVEWSWELLDDAERALLRRLSVFAGGVSLEAAEAVCAGPGLAAAEVFEVLNALVDKSLVVLRDGAEVPRYLLLETIRAYGRERLAEAGEQDRYRRAHAEYFTGLAEEAEPRLRRREQLEWLARLTADKDNLHAALRWAVAAGEAELAVRLIGHLGFSWWIRGRPFDLGDLAAEVLAMPDLPGGEATALAALFAALAMLGGPRDHHDVKAWLRLANDICDALGEQARHPMLRLMRPVIMGALTAFDAHSLARMRPLFTDPDPWVAAMARFLHGQVAVNIGIVDTAAEDIAVSLAGFREIGDRWGISFALAAQAELLAWQGRHREAIALYEEGRELVEELGGTVEDSLIHIYSRLAGELDLLGEGDRARRMLLELVRRVEPHTSNHGVAYVHHQLAELAMRAGDHAEAAARIERVRWYAAERYTGPPQFKAMAAAMAGRLAVAAGDLESARADLREALEQGIESRDNPVLALVLVGLADLACHEGDPGRAAEVLGMTDSVRGVRDLSNWLALTLEERLRAELGEDAFTAAYERGHARDFDEVLACFGMDRPPPPTL